MTAARVRVRLKGTGVYLLPQPVPLPGGDVSEGLLDSARDISRFPIEGYALVAFWTEGGDHQSVCKYWWNSSLGPIWGLPGVAHARLLRELLKHGVSTQDVGPAA